MGHFSQANEVDNIFLKQPISDPFRFKVATFFFVFITVSCIQVYCASPLAGVDPSTLLICRLCEESAPRSECLNSQEIQNACLQDLLDNVELDLQPSKRRGFIGKRGLGYQKRRGFIG
uniref:Neuropeptide S n=1 Tax=Mesocestoides corti TaxID=53468 RepID=A0A5K3FMM8_MESCO